MILWDSNHSFIFPLLPLKHSETNCLKSCNHENNNDEKDRQSLFIINQAKIDEYFCQVSSGLKLLYVRH